MNWQSWAEEQILVYRKKEKVLAGSPFMPEGHLGDGGVGQLCVPIKGVDEKVGCEGVVCQSNKKSINENCKTFIQVS